MPTPPDHYWYEPLTEWGIFALTMIGGLISLLFNSTLKGLQKEMETIKKDLQRQIDTKASRDTVDGLDKRLAEIAENAHEIRQGVDNLVSHLLNR